MANNDLSTSTEPAKTAKKTGTPARRSRQNTTSESILEAAEFVFSRSGYAGATVERIAKQAKCYESLIYYHFGSKDKLFSEVLQNAYRKLTEAEQKLKLDFKQPESALSEIILFLWNYYQKHPELIILLNTENLHKGKHVAKLKTFSEYLSPAVSIIRRTIDSGARQGIFRDDIDVIDLYIAIMGLGYFYLSNRYTLSAFLDKDLMTDAERAHWGKTMIDMVFASVRRP